MTTGTVKILSPIQTSCTPINHFQSVQYQTPKNCRLTARPTQYPQRGLHNTHSPQRGLGGTATALPKSSEGEDISAQHGLCQNLLHTLHTLYTHSTHSTPPMAQQHGNRHTHCGLHTQSKTPNGICGHRVCYAHCRGQSQSGIFWRRRSASTRTSGPGVFGSEIQINIHMDIIVIYIYLGTMLGIWYYWVRQSSRRSQARRRTLELIRTAPRRPTTHYEAWEDDYMGRG